MHIICIAGWRLMGKAAQMMAKAAFFAGDSKKTHQHRKNNSNIYIHIEYASHQFISLYWQLNRDSHMGRVSKCSEEGYFKVMAMAQNDWLPDNGNY